MFMLSEYSPSLKLHDNRVMITLNENAKQAFCSQTLPETVLGPNSMKTETWSLTKEKRIANILFQNLPEINFFEVPPPF